MTWIPSDAEISNVVSLEDIPRAEYAIKRIADAGHIWGLKDAGGWALLGDGQGVEAMPVWPHERFAEGAAIGLWAGATPGSVSVSDWLRAWSRGLESDGRRVAVFPTPDGKGVVMDPGEFASAISIELEKVE